MAKIDFLPVFKAYCFIVRLIGLERVEVTGKRNYYDNINVFFWAL